MPCVILDGKRRRIAMWHPCGERRGSYLITNNHPYAPWLVLVFFCNYLNSLLYKSKKRADNSRTARTFSEKQSGNQRTKRKTMQTGGRKLMFSGVFPTDEYLSNRTRYLQSQEGLWRERCHHKRAICISSLIRCYWFKGKISFIFTLHIDLSIILV